jgi:hypothetical protein
VATARTVHMLSHGKIVGAMLASDADLEERAHQIYLS